MLEPSKPRPSSKISSFSSLAEIEKCCQMPGRSMKRRSTIFTPFSRADSTPCFGVMRGPPFVAIHNYLFSEIRFSFEQIEPDGLANLVVSAQAGMNAERQSNATIPEPSSNTTPAIVAATKIDERPSQDLLDHPLRHKRVNACARETANAKLSGRVPSQNECPHGSSKNR